LEPWLFASRRCPAFLSAVHEGRSILMGATYDVAIAGCGIVGAACADEFARRGMRVMVIDRDMIGGGSTAAGMGHIVVMDDSRAQLALTRYSQQLWLELKNDLPPEVEYEQCGTIWIAADDEEMVEVRRKEHDYRQQGVPVEVLDGKQLESLEPNLRKGLAGGLLVPEDGVLYAPGAAKFLIERALANGATLALGTRAWHLGRGRVRTAGGQEFLAGQIVNATGTWACELTPGIGIKKRKGHLMITDRYPGFIRHQLVELGYLKRAHAHPGDSVAFNVQPRKTGQILIGSSRQYGADHQAVDPNLLRRMIERAEQYLPGLSALSVIRVWTGFRAATPDNLPLIGVCPGDRTVHLATGHEGLGITTSLATARLLADQSTETRSAIPREPYLPSRKVSSEAHA
jgi:glycine/D-amino acid oxidase-like deaminating enzyme